MTTPVAEEEEQLLSNRARSFLAADPPRHATIATVNRDGSPHQNVIWYRFVPGEDGADDRFVINSRRGRRWPANLEREGRASLTVFAADDALTILCELERSYEAEAALADISEMAHRYYEAEAAERDIAIFSTQERVSYVLRPIKVNIHGDPH